MKGTVRFALIVALAFAACGEDVVESTAVTSGTGEPSAPCVGDPCTSDDECRQRTAGSFCGTTPEGTKAPAGPVCFLPCDPSAAQPFCEVCHPIAGTCPPMGPCAGFCDPDSLPFSCEGG